MGAARVIGSIGGHGADPFTFGDQAEQFRQTRAVAAAVGVDSTARISDVAVSTAGWTLRHWRRP